MAKLLKLRRGTTTQHGSFTGAEGEVTIDTTKDTAVVHDGSTAGGTPLAKENMDNVSSTNIVTRISNSALAGVKVQPNFGSQDIETTGNIDLSDSTGTGNNRIKLGTGDDLEIYHNGSHSYIQDTGTGNLVLKGTEVVIQSGGNSESKAIFKDDGAVELYHNDSKKLETDSNGITVTGRVLASGTSNIGFAGVDNVKLSLGTSDDLQIYHDGTNSVLSNATGTLYYLAGTQQMMNLGGTETMAKYTENGAVDLYYDNAKKLETFASGVRWTGQLHCPTAGDTLQFTGANSNAFLIGMTSGADSPTGSDEHLQFHHWNGSAWEKTLFFQRHNVTIPDSNKAQFGNGADLQIYHSGSHSYVKNTTNYPLWIQNIDGQDVNIADNNGGNLSAQFHIGGAAELYYDNSKKFETTSGGAKVSGIAEFRQDSSVTDFTNLSAPGANNSGLYVQNVGGTTGNFAALSAIAHSGNSVGMSASFIAKSHATGYSPEVYITQRDGGNSQRTAIKITNPGAVELYNGGTKQVQTISSGLNWQDNKKAEFGNSGDLKLYHDGSSSYVTNSNSGSLFIQNLGNIVLEETDGTNHIRCVAGGETEIYYNGSKKFQTSSSGAYVTGQLTVDGGTNTYIYLKDSDNGDRAIHTNADKIGFLKQDSNWGAYCDDSGNWVAEGNVTAYSDARLKTDISTINDALGIVGKLRGVSYKWLRDGSDGIGVIAQEVEEVIPSVVVTNKKPGLDGMEEVKSVDYGKIVGVLINAINELKAEVDELKGGK